VYALCDVCARSLRAAVVLDLCPFGSRKCACAGGVGDAGVGGRREGRGWRRGERKNKVRKEGLAAKTNKINMPSLILNSQPYL
jgi:hypothetical protein